LTIIELFFKELITWLNFYFDFLKILQRLNLEKPFQLQFWKNLINIVQIINVIEKYFILFNFPLILTNGKYRNMLRKSRDISLSRSSEWNY
jgi:hypothetical protein